MQWKWHDSWFGFGLLVQPIMLEDVDEIATYERQHHEKVWEQVVSYKEVNEGIVWVPMKH